MTIVSSREFNRDTAAAKRAAVHGPVTITDRGRPAFVLQTYEDFVARERAHLSLADALTGPPGADDIELELPVRDIDPRTFHDAFATDT